MVEKLRTEDVMLEHYVQKYTLAAWKKYEPYEPCICKSGKKFKFCCYPLKKKSKAWRMTHNIIDNVLTKKRLRSKIKKFEGV